eukprot:jgi/Bigna1/141102/aug1.60_g15810
MYSRFHQATNYVRWLHLSRPEEIYAVNYTPDFEPFILLSTGAAHAVRYDERFFGYGYNKVSYVFRLHAAGVRFAVLPLSFLVHLPHVHSTARRGWWGERQFRSWRWYLETQAEQEQGEEKEKLQCQQRRRRGERSLATATFKPRNQTRRGEEGRGGTRESEKDDARQQRGGRRQIPIPAAASPLPPKSAAAAEVTSDNRGKEHLPPRIRPSPAGKEGKQRREGEFFDVNSPRPLPLPPLPPPDHRFIAAQAVLYVSVMLGMVALLLFKTPLRVRGNRLAKVITRGRGAAAAALLVALMLLVTAKMRNSGAYESDNNGGAEVTGEEENHGTWEPLVYVYPLPSSFHEDLLPHCSRASPSLSSSSSFAESSMFAAEVLIHRFFARHYPRVTGDPSEADLVFVPLYATCYRLYRLKVYGAKHLSILVVALRQ